MNNLSTHHQPLHVGLLSAAAVLLAGCASGGAPTLSTSPNLSAPSQAPSPSGQDDRAAVEAAYTAFWSRSLHSGDKPEDTWKDALTVVAVDPQLSTTLNAMRYQKQVGIKAYGDVAARIVSVQVNGASATVVDCQDASHAGQADAKTGDPKTVGVARNPVNADLKRDSADGQWKVAQVAFPGGTC